MKELTVYVAEDGARFDTRDSCGAHDLLVSRCRDIEAQLRPTPKDDHLEFANGGGYVQQLDAAYTKVKDELLMLYSEHCDYSHSTMRHIDEARRRPCGEAGFSMIPRLFDSGDTRPIDRIWHRLVCIDSRCREWGQPYFATHPNEGKQREIVTDTRHFAARKDGT